MDKKPPHVSLELLRELELQQDVLSESDDISDIAAEEELNFEQYFEREYQPEIWEEVESDHDSSSDNPAESEDQS